jgi:hypothetical protein
VGSTLPKRKGRKANRFSEKTGIRGVAHLDHEVFRETELVLQRIGGLAGGTRRRMKKLNVMRWSGYAAYD